MSGAINNTISPQQNGTDNNGTTTDAVNANFQNLMMFLCITAIVGSLVQGIAPKKLLKNVPQPVVILIIYLIVGVIFKAAFAKDVEAGIRTFVDPNAIQALFLPVLMFSEIFRLNTRAFFIVLGQLLLLVGPGVVLGACLTALFPLYIMPSRPLFDFNLSMAFGGMLATTDPIAIIICVNELSAPKRLAALVGGESLLNDGTSIVLVTLFLQLDFNQEVDPGEIVFFAFNQLCFSVLFGIAMGLGSLLFIRIVRDDSSTLTTFVVIIPFLTYVVSSYYFDSSGVLSIIPLGVILNDYGRGMMMEHVERIERLFDQLAFIATGWLYALSGFLVGTIIASSEISGVDWASLFILYFWINIVRFAMVMLAYPMLRCTGYGFSVAEAILLAFGGLRGAVGLTLALSIKNQLMDDNPRAASLVQFFMAGCILLMIANGVLAPVLMRRLKLDSKPNPGLMDALSQKMAEQCLTTLEGAGVDHHLAQYLAFGTTAQDIRQSRRRFTLVPPSGREEVSPGGDEDDATTQASNSNNHNNKPALPPGYVEHLLTKKPVQLRVLIEQRKHLVRAQRLMYEHLLTRGLISRGAWYVLDRAADAQLEVNHFYLDQFKFVVRQAVKSKRYFVVSRLQKGFYTCTAGKLLLFLEKLGATPIEEIMGSSPRPVRSSALEWLFHPGSHHHANAFVDPESGRMNDPGAAQQQQPARANADDDVDSEAWFPGVGEVGTKATGIAITPEEWCYNFALACWGFILAQQDSPKLVDEMLTVSASVDAFPTEREALKVEIKNGCTLPAQFLDAVAQYSPKILARVKRLHALSEAGNQLFGAVANLNAHGLLERAELKKLLKFAEKGLKRIRNCEFQLEMPVTVGNQAENLKENPNYYPFYRVRPSLPPGAVAVGLVQGPSREGSVEGAAQPQEISRAPTPMALSRAPSFLRKASSLSRLQPRIIQRRRSFGDFDPIHRRIIDGTEASWRELGEIEEETEAVGLSPGLFLDRLQPYDMQRMMEALRLEDSELKRY